MLEAVLYWFDFLLGHYKAEWDIGEEGQFDAIDQVFEKFKKHVEGLK